MNTRTVCILVLVNAENGIIILYIYKHMLRLILCYVHNNQSFPSACIITKTFILYTYLPKLLDNTHKHLDAMLLKTSELKAAT